MDSGSAPQDSGAPEGHREQQTTQFLTRLRPSHQKNTTNSHFFCTYAHNFNINDKAFTAKLAAHQKKLVEERTMIEAQQKVMDECGGDPMVYIFAGNGLSLGRRLLNAALPGQFN